MPNGHRNAMKPDTFVDELKNVSFKLRIMHQLTAKNYARLSKLSKALSSILPKVSDTTIFEIDDVIYGDDNNDVVAGSNVASQKTINYLVENCYTIFIELFISGKCKYDRFVEMAFLQLLELVPDRIYKTIPKDDVFGTLKTIAYDIEPGYLEHFLKVLKVSLNCHKEVIVMQFYTSLYSDEEEELVDFEDDDLYLLIALLLIFSHPEVCKSENQKETRKASWLTKQCSDMLETITTLREIDNDLKSYIATFKDEKKRYNSQFVWLLLHCMNPFVRKIGTAFCSKHLFKYFSSARNEDERRQRIDDFNDEVFESSGFYRFTNNIEKVLDFIPSFGFYTKQISDHIFKLFQQIKNYPSNTMKQLEQHCGFDVTSYLSNDTDCSTYFAFKEEVVELVEKNFTKSNIFVAKSEEIEFGEELSLYHEFVNGLQLIEIIYIIWLKMKNILKIDSIHAGFFDEYFRPHDSPIKASINELIADPTKRGRGDWWIQAILRKCPFLILPHDNNSHLENLMNLLIGRNVDKASEELLHSVINMNLKAPTKFYCYQENMCRTKVHDTQQLSSYPMEGSLFSTQPYSVNGRYVGPPSSMASRSNPVIYFINSNFIGYYYYLNMS